MVVLTRLTQVIFNLIACKYQSTAIKKKYVILSYLVIIVRDSRDRTYVREYFDNFLHKILNILLLQQKMIINLQAFK